MTVTDKIHAYLRGALNLQSRLSDFQMQVGKDAVVIVNLKTSGRHTIPVGHDDEDEDYGTIL